MEARALAAVIGSGRARDVLLPLRPRPLSSASRLAAAGRFHLGGGRDRVRDGATRAGALRRQDPGRQRPFRLPAASLVAPAGFALLALSALSGTNERPLSLDSRSAIWLWPYLLGMGTISYLSSFDSAAESVENTDRDPCVHQCHAPRGSANVQNPAEGGAMRLGVAARQAREHDPLVGRARVPARGQAGPRPRIARRTMTGKGACS